MQSKTKAIIMGVLSVILLVSGASTFALWRGSVDVVGAQARIGMGISYVVLPQENFEFTVLPVGSCPAANPMSHAQFSACPLLPGMTVSSEWTGGISADVPVQINITLNSLGSLGGSSGGVEFRFEDLDGNALPPAVDGWRDFDPANNRFSILQNWTINASTLPGASLVTPTITVAVRVAP